jgi:hypothetical protein
MEGNQKMLKINIQMFSEDDEAAKKKQAEEAANSQKTAEELEAERLAKEAAEQAKVEAEKQRNAEEARKRREKERNEEIELAKKQERIKTIIETVGTNPYTNKPIADEDDVETYVVMRQIELEKGDPIKDFPEYLKKNKKTLYEKQTQQKQREEQAQKEVDALIAAHPDVKLNDLLKDEDFTIFAKGKVGTIPLNEIYDDFLKFQKKYATKTDAEKEAAIKAAEEEAAKALAKQRASVGAIGGTNPVPPEYFSLEQISKMTLKETQANLDKVNRSIEYHKKIKK